MVVSKIPARDLGTLLGVLMMWGCGGVQRLPDNELLPSPASSYGAIICKAPAIPLTAQTRAAETLELNDAWQYKGAFAAVPLTGALRATDERPRWTLQQQQSMPNGRGLVPLGGDYWADSTYPVAPSDTPWTSSYYGSDKDPRQVRAGDDKSQGSMWRAFSSERRYLHVLVGGDEERHVGLELLAAPEDLAQCAQASRITPIAGASPTPGFERYQPVRVWRGTGQDALLADGLDLQDPRCNLRGKKLLLRAVDASTEHHLNLGPPELDDQPLATWNAAHRVPIWGWADFHTHPTSYLGFGGLQGIHTMWGVAGGSIKEYVGPDQRWNVGRDIPPCDDPHKSFNAHHGGLAAPLMLNFAEYRTSQTPSDLGTPRNSNAHPSQGAPSFRDFPHHERGAHFEYHVTQLHRAYLGGLRLMTALAVHNAGLEYGSGWVTCGPNGTPTVDTTADMDVVRGHVTAMRELADLNREWMEIAYTPEDARRIVMHNKLAVVLGVEVPGLGDSPDVALQVDELHALGVRQVIVVHGMDNNLGGTALFQDLYNTVNDWMYRDRRERDHIDEFSGEITLTPFKTPTVFFRVTTKRSPLDPKQDEPILFRLGNPPRIALSDAFPHPSDYTFQADILGIPLAYGPLHPLIYTKSIADYEQGPYDKYARGHRNPRGLSGRGREFIERLMRYGMLIDTAHMSDQTLSDTYRLLDQLKCDYPLMVSHAHFRRLGIKQDYSDRVADFLKRTSAWVFDDLKRGRYPMEPCVHAYAACPEKVNACLDDTPACQRTDTCVRRTLAACDPRVLRDVELTRQLAPYQGEGTISRGSLPREYDLSSAEVGQVKKRGGVIGAFIGQANVDGAPLVAERGNHLLPFVNDCAGSSKSFATALLFAQKLLGHRQLGVASDFAMTSGELPRFGPDACGAYLDAGAGSESAAKLLEVAMEPSQYRVNAQTDAVVYSSGVASCLAAQGGAPALAAINCGKNAPLDPYVMGERTFDYNVDGMANFGLMPDMLQDTVNVLGSERSAVGELFGSAEDYVAMWEHAREAAGLTPETPDAPEPADPRACGASCPSSFNRGAPLQALSEFFDNCPVGKPIKIPAVDSDGNAMPSAPIYGQHRADPRDATPFDLSQQGDWALFSVGAHPVWTCGEGRLRPMSCPAGTKYVKVRRVLDATLDKLWDATCERLPLPPENGNRAVLFQCLAGPHLDQSLGVAQ